MRTVGKAALTVALALVGALALTIPAHATDGQNPEALTVVEQENLIIAPPWSVEYEDHCDGSSTVTITNDSHFDLLFKIRSGDFTPEAVLITSESSQTFDWPVEHSQNGISVHVKLGYKWYPVGEGHRWYLPKDCPQPTATLDEDCTGFTVTVNNPTGNPSLDAVVEVGEGFQTVNLDDIAAGNSATTPLITSAVPQSVEVTYTYPYWGEESQPTATHLSYNEVDCPTPTPTPTQPPSGGGGGDALPTTGSKPLAIAGTGAAAVVIGVLLWLIGRRRQPEASIEN